MGKQDLPVCSSESKKDMLARLSRIEGQVRGVARMIEDGRSSMDVLQQLASAQASLRSASKSILRNHLECCCSAPASKGDDSMYDELMDVIYKFAK
jgi:CsoR family transcriptional regulator, copper-sensing transcriptional repressor